MMHHVVDVVKRGRRKSELFDPEKLRRSVFAACVGERCPEGQATQIAQQVCSSVEKWFANKHEITSEDIRRQASATLVMFHPEAAYLYKHHRMIM
ncbi:hypothetical protein IPM09_00150 [Candidatus Saccharibacteria bacterium]|nr:MAG: hypothetical protein IPM09_00150 [Candidatus Saccharibacteria bacterium]